VLGIVTRDIEEIDVAALDDGSIVGWTRLVDDRLEALVVDPGAVGTGVGTALVRHAVRRAASAGITGLMISASADTDDFYVAMGAERGVDALVLSVPSALVRFGYDDISGAYRGDDDIVEEYREWIDGLALEPGARVLDLGCGCGIPADRLLVAGGAEVLGVDFSAEQVRRARELVPEARFECADIADWDAPDDAFDVVVSFYALIHVPRDVQRALAPRLARWLRPGGVLLATIGSADWTGIDDYLGQPMFWDHADPDTTVGWLTDAGFDVRTRQFVPEGDSGHELVFAVRRADPRSGEPQAL
jgi:SAM-dependent methyltransferase